MHDERLMAALLDWYWFDSIEGADEQPIGPPTPEAFEEMRSLLRHLAARGYVVKVADDV
jgi:hypothetical protein